MPDVAEQIESLTRAFLEGVRDLRIVPKTPADSVGPLVVLQSTGSAAAIARLTERGVLASARSDGLRFAFHVYNNMDDVHAALAALQDNLDLMVRF